jgi:beta-lactam-binding protein with PASTA domain
MKKNYLISLSFLAPFFLFFLGYLCTRFALSMPRISVPFLVGTSAIEAIKKTSQINLSLKVMREKEVSDMPEGVILDQVPAPGVLVRPFYNVFITISKKPPVPCAPNLFKKTSAECKAECEKNKIILEERVLYSKFPKGECFMQEPRAEQPLSESSGNKVTVYISAGSLPFIVLPDARGLEMAQAKKLFEEAGVRVSCVNDSGSPISDFYDGQCVRAQRPVAGSVFNVNASNVVQLLC